MIRAIVTLVLALLLSAAAAEAQEKPTSSNTGPNGCDGCPTPTSTFASLYGSTTITSPGLYEDFTHTGQLTIASDNVTIRNCIIDGGYDGGTDNSASAGGAESNIKFITNEYSGIVIEYCELRYSKGSAIWSSSDQDDGVIIQYNWIHDHGADGLKPEGGEIIRYNLIEKIGYGAGSHADGVQISQGSNIDVIGNVFDTRFGDSACLSKDGVECKGSLPVFAKPDFGVIDNVLFEGNWLMGGNFNASVSVGGSGAATNVTYHNNLHSPDKQPPLTCPAVNNGGCGGADGSVRYGQFQGGGTTKTCNRYRDDMGSGAATTFLSNQSAFDEGSCPAAPGTTGTLGGVLDCVCDQDPCYVNGGAATVTCSMSPTNINGVVDTVGADCDNDGTYGEGGEPTPTVGSSPDYDISFQCTSSNSSVGSVGESTFGVQLSDDDNTPITRTGQETVIADSAFTIVVSCACNDTPCDYTTDFDCTITPDQEDTSVDSCEVDTDDDDVYGNGTNGEPTLTADGSPNYTFTFTTGSFTTVLENHPIKANCTDAGPVVASHSTTVDVEEVFDGSDLVTVSTDLGDLEPDGTAPDFAFTMVNGGSYSMSLFENGCAGLLFDESPGTGGVRFIHTPPGESAITTYQALSPMGYPGDDGLTGFALCGEALVSVGVHEMKITECTVDWSGGTCSGTEGTEKVYSYTMFTTPISFQGITVSEWSPFPPVLSLWDGGHEAEAR